MAKSTTSTAAIIPAGWKQTAERQKTLIGWPTWSEPAAIPSARAAVPSREELRTVSAEITEVVIPLGDEHGVGLEGVQLRLNAWAYKRNHEATATLEVTGGRSFVTIARLDGWPASPHMNTVARKHPALRHLPPLIAESHVHRFGDNAQLGAVAFTPLRNLPAAAPVDPLTSFRGFLRTVGVEFVIEGLDTFDPPPWQEYLL